MTGAGAGVILIAAGAVLRSPALLAVGAIVELVAALRSLWTRFGLRNLVYERHLETQRVPVGEEIGLDLVVRNRKLLPLPWLAIEDHVTRGANIVGRQLDPSARPGFVVLRTTWTLGWFQRVTRRFRILADRRGVYEFRDVNLLVGDLFSDATVVEEREMPLRYRVVPRSVPVRGAAHLSEVPGTVRRRHGLFEEPTLYAGVRPYRAGDPLRRIHWKATARLGRPISRRYDPGVARETILAVDAQTIPGPFWRMSYQEDRLEGIYTAALSQAQDRIRSGAACGLAANAYSRRPERTVYLPPSAAAGQIGRIADTLASLSSWASLPFANLLDALGPRVPPSTTIVALTSLPTIEVLAVLRALQVSGRDVHLVAFGPDAAGRIAGARSLGIPASPARLEPDWATSDALDLAG
ncbi:MAG TPA: DUF58 domain-containing protein [Candidatus Binatus sp.]|nr:DUF58 domain-containing protein [Candidatus Binatus sp.]